MLYFYLLFSALEQVPALRATRRYKLFDLVRLKMALYGLVLVFVGYGLFLVTVDYMRPDTWGLVVPPSWWAFYFVLALVISDLLRYVIHWMMHRFDFLWNFHAFHHQVKEVDSLVSIYAHPIEIVLVYSLRTALWVAIFSLFELPMFTITAVAAASMARGLYAWGIHTNVDLRAIPLVPKKFWDYLEMIFHTPDTHRTHHLSQHTGKNLGEIFNWDQIFGTFQPTARENGADYGLGSDDSRYSKKLYQQILYPFWRSPFTAPSDR